MVPATIFMSEPKVIGHFEPLSLNKFFDPSTPYMRKVDNGEKQEKKGKEKRMVKIAVHERRCQLTA